MIICVSPTINANAPKGDVDLSPSDTVNNLRDLGFDFTVVMETDEDCGADLDLFGHLSCRENLGNLGWID